MRDQNSFMWCLSDIAQGWRDASVSCQLASPPPPPFSSLLLLPVVGIVGTKRGHVQSVFRTINWLSTSVRACGSVLGPDVLATERASWCSLRKGWPWLHLLPVFTAQMLTVCIWLWKGLVSAHQTSLILDEVSRNLRQEDQPSIVFFFVFWSTCFPMYFQGAYSAFIVSICRQKKSRQNR